MSARRELEIATGFVLDQVRVGRIVFDVLDSLLIVSVTQANVDAVLRDPALQNAYAAYDSPPPDHLRRPISVNALATSLRLPFETVRRRIQRLALAGVVKSGPQGVWTPTTGLLTLTHRATLEAAYGRLQALHARLGWDGAAGDPAPPPALCDGWPLRAAARLSGAYLLRLVERLTGEIGDVLDVVIWLGVLSGRGAAPTRRRPASSPAVRIAPLAKALGLSLETVRRRVAGLVSQALLAWTADGLIVDEAAFARPALRDIVDGHAADLRRMYAGLAQLQPHETVGAGRAAA